MFKTITEEEKMAINDLNDGVGKKIVEALKMQSAEHADGEVFVNNDAPEIIEEPIYVEEEVQEEVPGDIQHHKERCQLHDQA